MIQGKYVEHENQEHMIEWLYIHSISLYMHTISLYIFRVLNSNIRSSQTKYSLVNISQLCVAGSQGVNDSETSSLPCPNLLFIKLSWFGLSVLLLYYYNLAGIKDKG